MIEIGTKRVSEYGRNCRKITRLKALSLQDLPDQYFEDTPAIYLKRNGSLVVLPAWDHARTIWSVGDLVDEPEFQKVITIIRSAGERLRAINEGKERPPWRGKETVRI